MWRVIPGWRLFSLSHLLSCSTYVCLSRCHRRSFWCRTSASSTCTNTTSYQKIGRWSWSPYVPTCQVCIGNYRRWPFAYLWVHCPARNRAAEIWTRPLETGWLTHLRRSFLWYPWFWLHIFVGFCFAGHGWKQFRSSNIDFLTYQTDKCKCT